MTREAGRAAEAPPPTAGDKFISLPGRHPDGRRSLRLHYRDWGGNGRPVLLLHGLASNARIWDLVAPGLVEPFRVIALDQRGHGLSDKPADGYTFHDVGGDLAAFIEALRLDKPLIVGHSWGGNVALEFATGRSDLVSGLVLVDGGFLEITAIEGMTWEKTREVMAPPPLDGVQLEDFVKAARASSELDWSDDIEEIALASFDIRPNGTIYPRLTLPNHMKILRAAWEQKPSLLWERLLTPALLIPAAHDDPDPATAMWMAAKRRVIGIACEKSPSIQVRWMRNTIHDVPLQRPRELAEAITGFALGLPRFDGGESANQ